MKVIIVDDEIYICKLVRHLIDWDGLGLRFLAMFQNYEDTLAQFEKEPADILICDIEMPGKNGIELIREVKEKHPDCRCVVISGFRNFDYVHAAMQYGAVNYLLKPIDGEELNKVLLSVIDSTKGTASRESIIGERNTRTSFLGAVNAGIVEQDTAAINRRYHYRFQPGLYNALKLSFTEVDPKSEHLPQIMRRFDDSVRQRLLDICFEVEIYHGNAVLETIIINYDMANGKRMNFMLDQILSDALSEIGGISTSKCVVGVGLPVGHIGELKVSLKTAAMAWCASFYASSKQIFYAEALDIEKMDNTDYALPASQKKDLRNIIESIDPEEFRRWLDATFKDSERIFHSMPYLIYVFCTQVLETFITVLEELHSPVKDKNEFRSRYEIMFYNSHSTQVLMESLSALISGELMLRLSEKQSNASLYVQQAKNYIEKHYAEAVTLEAIAAGLHINPVYLSVLFKNETGLNYSKYLTQVRMARAKELLKKPDMNITQIANAVGYDSTYYFSTLFKKEALVKPTEYRRLYQLDLDE